MPVEISFEFREKLHTIIEGNLLSFCYQCGACVGDCPTARFDPTFNPRHIMLEALYGLEKRLICEDSPVWKCANCYTCYERCPQHMKPVEVIIALKNLLANEGLAPAGVVPHTDRSKTTGRSVLVTSATERIRAELGLPPLPQLPVDELTEILKP